MILSAAVFERARLIIPYLGSSPLRDILTNRTRLSGDIPAEVLAVAAGYGVDMLRADVKDPQGHHESHARDRAAVAHTAPRARSKAETQRIEAVAKAEARRVEATAEPERQRLAAESECIRMLPEVESTRQREQVARIFTTCPALLRLRELETLRECTYFHWFLEARQP